MQIEIREWPTHERAEFEVKLKNYYSEAEKLKRQLQHARTSFGKRNKAGKRTAADSEEADQRTRLLDTHQNVYTMDRSLESSKQGILESEQIGSATIATLVSQREQLESAKDNVNKTKLISNFLFVCVLSAARAITVCVLCVCVCACSVCVCV